MQEEDWTVDGAMTDPKGDRGLPPCKQADPDLYVHIAEKREDGIIVRGAKAHQTGAINSHWVLVMPTSAMSKRMPTMPYLLPPRAMPRASSTFTGASLAIPGNWRAATSMSGTPGSAGMRP